MSNTEPVRKANQLFRDALGESSAALFDRYQYIGRRESPMDRMLLQYENLADRPKIKIDRRTARILGLS